MSTQKSVPIQIGMSLCLSGSKIYFFAKKELRKNKDIVRYLFQWIGTNFYWTLWQNLQSVMLIKTSKKNKPDTNSNQFDPFVSSNIWFLRIPIFNQISVIHAKNGRYLRYISAIFLDFPQNFRLRTWNQYCTQAIAWGSTI